jgi:hypothetical protein
LFENRIALREQRQRSNRKTEQQQDLVSRWQGLLRVSSHHPPQFVTRGVKN